jgi:hypothetical protein
VMARRSFLFNYEANNFILRREAAHGIQNRAADTAPSDVR